MNIIYIANARIPTEKAHGLQIMKTCSAFVAAGHTLLLIVPQRDNPLAGVDPFEYYSSSPRFTIKHLPSLDLVSFGKIGFLIQSATFAISVFLYMLFQKPDLVYGRDEQSLFYVSLTKKRVVYEVHTNEYNFFVRKLLRRNSCIVSITEGLKKFYVKKGVPDERIIVAPDALDEQLFTMALSKEEARKRLALSLDKNIIVYTGHLYGWKGAQYVAQAAHFLPEDTLFYFVGGTENDIIRFRKECSAQKNVYIVGHKPHNEMPYWQRASDVLVLPNTGKVAISRLYTSPAKLFEYMASERPIVASNISSLTEVLTDLNAILVKPDDAKDLAKGIRFALEHKQESKKRAQQAKSDAEAFTWNKRAVHILEYI